MEQNNNNNSNNLIYIDSHCHLQDYSENDLEKILESCKKENFSILYSNATNNKDFEKNLKISEKYSSDKTKIISGFGFHPWYLDYPINNEKIWIEELKEFIKINLIDKNKNFFIGEIGIDGGKIKKTFSLETQIEIFKKQIELANELNVLVHIHCVYEWDKLFKILNNMKIENLIKNNKIILHCFQGKKKHIEKFNNLNCYFSISSGCFTKGNFEMLKNLPNNKILFESDSPSMFNKEIYSNENEYKHFYNEDKKNNSPESIKFLCKKFAELKEINEIEFCNIIYNNSLKVFNDNFNKI